MKEKIVLNHIGNGMIAFGLTVIVGTALLRVIL